MIQRTAKDLNEAYRLQGSGVTGSLGGDMTGRSSNKSCLGMIVRSKTDKSWQPLCQVFSVSRVNDPKDIRT